MHVTTHNHPAHYLLLPVMSHHLLQGAHLSTSQGRKQSTTDIVQGQCLENCHHHSWWASCWTHPACCVFCCSDCTWLYHNCPYADHTQAFYHNNLPTGHNVQAPYHPPSWGSGDLGWLSLPRKKVPIHPQHSQAQVDTRDDDEASDCWTNWPFQCVHSP